MKFKNTNGITIVSLVITVIVLIILSSVTLYTGNNIVKKAKLQTINTNMMLIQAKTKTIEEQAKFNKNTSNYKGTVVSNISANEKIDKLITNGIIEDVTKYYLLTKSDLESMGLGKIEIDDGYIVNYETEEVIYVKGFEQNGQTYYKLSRNERINCRIEGK